MKCLSDSMHSTGWGGSWGAGIAFPFDCINPIVLGQFGAGETFANRRTQTGAACLALKSGFAALFNVSFKM